MREVERQGGREAGRQGGREAGRQGGREAARQGGREAGRQGGGGGRETRATNHESAILAQIGGSRWWCSSCRGRAVSHLN